MRIVRILALLFIAPALLAQSIDTNAVDRVARDTMTRWKVPGLAVAVVRNDKVVYLKGYGTRQLGAAVPVTPDTVFQIGSDSKAFTTTALAMLVDEKKVDWDDPVRKHVEYFHLADPCADSLVTVRDIVTHRSGLSRHDELWDYTNMTREQVIRAVSTVRLTRPIRTSWQYSNIMYMLAGEVVASAAKMPWADFVTTRIFNPLGMRSSSISEADWEKSEHAAGYWYNSKTDQVLPQAAQAYESLAPAGTIKSSARDMAQWLRFQLANGSIDGKRLVSEEAIVETKTRVEKKNAPETNILTYGMAWGVQDYRGELLVSHGGALNGFRANVALLPNQNAGVVVLANLGRSSAVTALRNSIVDLILARGTRDWNGFYLDREAASRSEAETKKAERAAKWPRNTKPSHELGAYAGTYQSDAYGPAVVALSNDRLSIKYGRIIIPLTHRVYDTFDAIDEEEDLDETVTFTTDPDGMVNTLTLFGEEFARKEK
jgi:CubicO group peptidase (beta-lactamase class C family)